jgi:hypothetical protein
MPITTINAINPHSLRVGTTTATIGFGIANPLTVDKARNARAIIKILNFLPPQ